MSVPPPPHIAPYLKKSSWRGIMPPRTGFSADQLGFIRVVDPELKKVLNRALINIQTPFWHY
ncbi:hypothetical protein M422DRAFT_248323 [Sphaerobolus stellatus SS14]|uniref:Uncharacterized protein n=1 Tax=Sphaerobolus stellatus (strain SS14) TaxID=990650 RepID=A0A0C9W4I8_SPHS4|nr:hypothetical protein M422DRAFT_248323 [Sphaerobolus stellatus SS14]